MGPSPEHPALRPWGGWKGTRVRAAGWSDGPACWRGGRTVARCAGWAAIPSADVPAFGGLNEVSPFFIFQSPRKFRAIDFATSM